MSGGTQTYQITSSRHLPSSSSMSTVKHDRRKDSVYSSTNKMDLAGLNLLHTHKVRYVVTNLISAKTEAEVKGGETLFFPGLA